MFLIVPPTTEETHLDVRAADAEGFLAVHRVPKGGARILLGPHSRQPAGVLQAHVHGAADEHAGKAALNRAVCIGVKAEEIVLAIGAAGVVQVRSTGHAEFVRVVTAHILHGDAVLQCLPPEAARDVVDAADFSRQSKDGLIQLIAGKLVVGRE